jgi:hypothetical protein
VKRVLLVAPRSDLLAVDAEIQDVLRSGLIVTPLIGSVTSTDLLREMRSGRYDTLWFATHGNGEGIQLSDGVFSASELVPQVRDRFTLVVLNSCSSLNIAQLLQEEAGVGVICTLIDVPDRQAYQTGSRLASALAQSSNVVDAYLASKPGNNRSYLYLASFEVAAGAIDKLVAEMASLRAELQNERRWWRLLAVLAVGFYPAAWLIMWSIINRF